MKEKIKTDYLKYLFAKTLSDLSRFNVSSKDADFLKKLFARLSHSDNPLVELYILCNIREFRNIGKYLIFVYKKIEEDTINFDNLSQNINSDAEYIENELLNYLSNPGLSVKFKHIVEQPETESFQSIAEDETSDEDLTGQGISEMTPGNDENYEEEDITKFKKNYLELIQSEETPGEDVFDLPFTEIKSEKDGDISGSETTIDDSQNADQTYQEEEAGSVEDPATEEIQTEEEIIFPEEDSEDVSNIEEIENKESIIGEEEIFSDEKGEDTGIKDELDEKVFGDEPERIVLSEEIQEELNLFDEKGGAEEEEEETETIAVTELPPTNENFIEYENEITAKNKYMRGEFEKMIKFVNERNPDEELRLFIITGIINTSVHLETVSRKMSLEIISNIYQTITLSFEKISDGKYDLSESTLNLFKKGLALVGSLIKGDDYFGYKDILKSIENIRNSLLEEKEKREKYLQRLKEKMELEESIEEKVQTDSERESLNELKRIIKDTETKFSALDKISGEYHIYEALRSLSGNLNNFKEIVRLSKELKMQKLVQLAEAGYIFTKFLQNYRINPVTTEIKEIFGYINYNLKSLIIGKPVEDADLFISYLNDPVKIFSKTEKKKK